MLTITVGFSHSGHNLIVYVGILLPANIIKCNLPTGYVYAKLFLLSRIDLLAI